MIDRRDTAGRMAGEDRGYGRRARAGTGTRTIPQQLQQRVVQFGPGGLIGLRRRARRPASEDTQQRILRALAMPADQDIDRRALRLRRIDLQGGGAKQGFKFGPPCPTASWGWEERRGG